jgi:hypothetical protein
LSLLVVVLLCCADTNDNIARLHTSATISFELINLFMVSIDESFELTMSFFKNFEMFESGLLLANVDIVTSSNSRVVTSAIFIDFVFVGNVCGK